MKMTTLLVAAALLATSDVLLLAENHAATFNVVCAKPDLPPQLKPLVAELVEQYGSHGVKVWGDRAVAVPLHSSGTPMYFVPVSCGATGNCTWGIVATSPVRSLGVTVGAVITVERHGSQWPRIRAFTRTGAGEGDLDTFEFATSEYKLSTSKSLSGATADKFASCIDNERCCK